MTGEQVYAIAGEVTGLVKFGFSIDPERRLRDLQTGSPDRLRLLGACPGGAAVEARIHTALAAHRRHGEWFAPSSEVLTFVGAVVTGHVDVVGMEGEALADMADNMLADRARATQARLVEQWEAKWDVP